MHGRGGLRWVKNCLNLRDVIYGRPPTSVPNDFWGGGTIFWTVQNTFLPAFVNKCTPNLSKLEIVYIKIVKCRIPGPGNCLVLSIGVDANGVPRNTRVVYLNKWFVTHLRVDGTYFWIAQAFLS